MATGSSNSGASGLAEVVADSLALAEVVAESLTLARAACLREGETTEPLLRALSASRNGLFLMPSDMVCVPITLVWVAS
jgi:hypothetical protein